MSDKNNNNTEKEFPGYPHYPAKEDILNQPDSERVKADVENLSRSNTKTSSALPEESIIDESDKHKSVIADTDDDVLQNNEADVTEEDLILLDGADTKQAKLDTLEGEADLDIPGAEEDDANEAIGEEDEENNYYSLGGDAHEDLEEDKG